MKKILALLLAAIMVLSMAACATTSTPDDTKNTTGGNEDGTPTKVALTVWGPSEDQVDENSWLNVMLKKFEEAHPEYEITWTVGVCPEGDAATKVTADVEAAADVYMYANDQLGTLLNAQALAELGGSYLEQVKTDNSQIFVDTVTYSDGGVYGFPYTANTWFMYYDTRTYSAEDVKSLETMLEKGTVAFPITNSWYIWSFYAANGGTLFGENGIDASAGIKLGDNASAVTKYLVDLAKNPNFINDGAGEGLGGFRDGTVDAMFSGTWDAAAIKEALTDEEGVCHMGVAQLPTIKVDGKDCQLRSFAGSKAIGVNQQSKNMAVAMKLAAFLGSVEAQKLHYELRQIPPATTSLDSLIAEDIVAAAQAQTMANTACGQPTIPEMGNYWTPAGNLGTAVYNGEVTHDNAAEQTELFEQALNNTGL